MKTDDFMTNNEKKAVRQASKDINIWKYNTEAKSAASKNIRARVI